MSKRFLHWTHVYPPFGAGCSLKNYPGKLFHKEIQLSLRVQNQYVEERMAILEVLIRYDMQVKLERGELPWNVDETYGLEIRELASRSGLSYRQTLKHIRALNALKLITYIEGKGTVFEHIIPKPIAIFSYRGRDSLYLLERNEMRDTIKQALVRLDCLVA